MAFHRKYESLLLLKSDVAIIPECSCDRLLAEKAPQFIRSSSVWIGDNRHKGLGVFTFGAYTARLSPVYRQDMPHISPVRIDGPVGFNLLAVWACHNKTNSYVDFRGPLSRAIEVYRSFLSEGPAVVAGDFNDNVRWDKPTKINKHSTNVRELACLGLKSTYHLSRAVDRGDESESTIYWRDRKIDGPRYHIDYCFVSDAWTKSLSAVTVGSFGEWVATGLSDHVPLTVDLVL
jgi:exodeoxyribonuclease III